MAKSSTATLITSLQIPISIVYRLIQDISAITVAMPTRLGINNFSGEERRVAKGAPMMGEA